MPEDEIALLIVEDDTESLDLYSRFIRTTFPLISVDTATNPEEAISLFKQHQHNIVVSDMRVPKEYDGLLIAQVICEEKPDAQIFFVTADYNRERLAREAKVEPLCVKATLGKPLNVNQLILKIREAIANLTKQKTDLHY